MEQIDVLRDAIQKAFDPTKPGYYANIFYISGTNSDIRIAFGTVKPRTDDPTNNVVDKFDLSVTVPHSLARDLAEKIIALLEGANK